MATYAIGDIQGCAKTLALLIERIGFDERRDHIIMLGDVVNRGPASLAALRWAYHHEHCATMVLGNHDLALLAHAAGVRPLRPKDTLTDIMAANDKDELLAWLALRPFAHLHSYDGGHVLALHAGVLPHWSVEETLHHAKGASEALRGAHRGAFLAALEAHKVPHEPVMEAVEAARVLTYLRVLGSSAEPEYTFKGPQWALHDGLVPWFRAPERKTSTTPIVCGHWAALGLHMQDNVFALDTGCVWGGKLTALCLETRKITQVAYCEATPPLLTPKD